MTEPLMTKVEQHAYSQLFRFDLHWSAPDHPPIHIETEDGETLTATNVSSYKGLRVWVCDKKPGTKLEALLDREIAKTSTDRLVIFHDQVDQVWRWPVRQVKESTTTTRLTSHRHRNGIPNPKFEDRLASIRLPTDKVLDPNTVLAKVRAAFDVEVQNETKRASKLMARMYSALEKCYLPDFPPKQRDHEISVTLARTLFLMFGDDTDMWAADLFRDLIHDHSASNGSDLGELLTRLFEHLDTEPTKTYLPEPEFKDFPYVNGGIFETRLALPKTNPDLREAILDACAVDWSTISPAIFGSMFQSVRDATTRRELGEHYTSEENILKTLNPLFLDELRAEFERAKAMKNESLALRRLRDRLGEIRYMDPACGCGNFIIVAYRELRDLELSILERLQDIGAQDAMMFANTGLKVSLDHFYGIEIDEWPARIAETAMFLMDRQCDLKLTERLGWAPDRLPIQEQAKIVIGNALSIDWSSVCEPSEHVVVAGNPPFLGDHTRSAEQKAELQAAWGAAVALSRMDYVTGWHAKTLHYFDKCNGVWAFVATSSITQGDTVARLFRPIFGAGWHIKFAHRTFMWTSEASGAAAVHCVIIGFSRDSNDRLRLFDYPSYGSPPRELAGVRFINAYLVDSGNVLVTKRSTPINSQLRQPRYGSKPSDGGFLVVRPADYEEVARDPIALKYLRPYVGTDELLYGIQRWCLWLVDAKPSELADSPVIAGRIAQVRDARLQSKAPSTRAKAATPHLFGQRAALPTASVLGIPEVSSENRLFMPVAHLPAGTVVSNKVYSAPDDDGFLFAIASSSMFMAWQKTVGGRLESRLSFSNTIVWNNFPMPMVTDSVKQAICDAGSRVLEARSLYPDRSIAQLYDTDSMELKLLQAHAELDSLVDQAFGSTSEAATLLARQHILFDAYQAAASA